MNPTNSPNLDRRLHRIWGLALLGLVMFTFWRVGGFDPTTALDTGRTVPNTYGTVDHPFHAARAAALLDSLRNGQLLRWMGSHQGGYPVEFYPLGIAWLDVAFWGMLLGSIPILAVHKITVAVIFVLPALAYWLLVRGDRLHPSVAFLAMAFHVAIPGYWLNGGYEELVGWGLVTNVAGASFAVISTILMARYVLQHEHWCGVLAVVAVAAGAASNPRSLFGVVIATLAIGGLSLAVDREVPVLTRLKESAVSIAVVGGLALLIAAPVITSLLRYSGEYFFLHYQFYEPLNMYWDALEMALSPRILWLAIAGAIVVLTVRRVPALRVSQAIATAVGLYTMFTIWVARSVNPPPLIEQLEAPRLMPYQRLLMLALAAIVIVLVVQWLTSRLDRRWRELSIAVVVVVVSGYAIGTMIDRPADVPLNENALYAVGTVGNQTFADMEDAVELANDLRPEGTAIFVVGNQQEFWHEQLWAAGIEPGGYYYDDWMWYWHSLQPGPYDPSRGYYMDNPTDALTQEYFDQHGIGVVMVSDMYVPSGVPPRQAAARSDLLELQGTFGGWDIYSVKNSSSLATRGEELPQEIHVGNQEIRATFPDGSGDVVVRQNWFPRWQAEVNGEAAEIERDSAGYMRIEVPDGDVEVVLTYGVTNVDWAARAASALGVLGTGIFAWRGSMWRSSWSAGAENGDN